MTMGIRIVLKYFQFNLVPSFQLVDCSQRRMVKSASVYVVTSIEFKDRMHARLLCMISFSAFSLSFSFQTHDLMLQTVENWSCRVGINRDVSSIRTVTSSMILLQKVAREPWNHPSFLWIPVRIKANDIVTGHGFDKASVARIWRNEVLPKCQSKAKGCWVSDHEFEISTGKEVNVNTSNYWVAEVFSARAQPDISSSDLLV